MLIAPVILLAEDGANDAFLLQRALDKAQIPNSLLRVVNGKEAIDYFEGSEPYRDRSLYPLPGLVLLDLKMPLMDGFEVLTWLQKARGFRNLPVVVLSSSALEADMQKARSLGAADYRIKPPDFDALVVMVRELHLRWLTPVPA